MGHDNTPGSGVKHGQSVGSDIFAHGQAYVALSKVRTLAGVLLCNFNVACLKLTDPKVLGEYRRLLGLV
jgi:hypothetical protein